MDRPRNKADIGMQIKRDRIWRLQFVAGVSNYGRGMSEAKAKYGVSDLGGEIQEKERHITSCSGRGTNIAVNSRRVSIYTVIVFVFVSRDKPSYRRIRIIEPRCPRVGDKSDVTACMNH